MAGEHGRALEREERALEGTCWTRLEIAQRLKSWRALESTGEHWKALESTGGHWRALESTGEHWRAQENRALGAQSWALTAQSSAQAPLGRLWLPMGPPLDSLWGHFGVTSGSLYALGGNLGRLGLPWGAQNTEKQKTFVFVCFCVFTANVSDLINFVCFS